LDLEYWYHWLCYTKTTCLLIFYKIYTYTVRPPIIVNFGSTQKKHNNERKSLMRGWSYFLGKCSSVQKYEIVHEMKLNWTAFAPVSCKLKEWRNTLQFSEVHRLKKSAICPELPPNMTILTSTIKVGLIEEVSKTTTDPIDLKHIGIKTILSYPVNSTRSTQMVQLQRDQRMLDVEPELNIQTKHAMNSLNPAVPFVQTTKQKL